MTVTFAAATPQDAAGLAAILRGWIYETAWMPKLHSPDQDLAFLHHLIATQTVIAARLDAAPVGFMALELAEITCLYLAPARRGQGVGAGLLNRAKSLTPQLTAWTFQANSGARRFYAREGFVEAHLTDGADNDEHLPDVRLIWERAAP